jgi:hypothetical protein
MNLSASIPTLVVYLSTVSFTALAHPGSGIVVDREGNVYFTHSGRGCGKIDSQGRLTYVHNSKGGHWMCLDAKGTFSHVQPRYFDRITSAGAIPALIFADGGSPIAVPGDGNLYYVSNGESLTPGGLQVTRMSADGVTSTFAPDLAKVTEKAGITGLAPGPDGTICVALPNAILKVKTDGSFSTLANPVVVTDCDEDYPDGNRNIPLPGLRGLAVDDHGTVFAAGTGCHRVLKITAEGKVETMLKSERPWSPTGVAVRGADVYVLEYTNANGGPGDGWRPRIRKLERDGKVTTLVTVPSDPDKKQEGTSHKNSDNSNSKSNQPKP